MFRRGGRHIAAKLVAPSRATYFVGVALILAPVVYTAVGVARHGPPAPVAHDEFSYLFAGETFSKGRMSNPQHPLWESFETFHVLSRPTRASKYPVAQGLVLTLGSVVFEEPWAGVLLSVAFMLGTLYWALTGWVPPHWAMLGTLLASVHFGGNHYWIDSYWGGSVAASGGCLLLGVLGRVRANPASSRIWVQGAIAAVGLSILANSRPWEGLLLSIAVLAYVSASLASGGQRSWRDRSRSLARFFIPCAVLVAMVGSMMAYYNVRTTGRWNVMPYMVYQQTYHATKVFLFESDPPVPKYNHEIFRAFFTEWEPNHQKGIAAGSIGERLRNWAQLECLFISDLIGSPISAILVGVFAPFLIVSERSRPAVVIVLATTLGFLLQRYHGVHHQAPLAASFILLKVFCLQRIAEARSEASAAGVAAALLIAADAGIGWTSQAWRPSADCCVAGRPTVMNQLRGRPGLDLVVMRYSADHSPHCEWVYNEPDIDASEVVWAREMTPERNCELTRYFNDRKIWLLEPDSDDPEPKPAPDWCAPE